MGRVAGLLLGGGLLILLGTGCQKPTGEEIASPPERLAATVTAARERTEKQPNSPAAWVALGQSYLDAEKYNDAFIAYKRAWALDQKDLAALHGLATTSLQLLNPQAAQVWVDRALALNPRDGEALGMRGEVKLAQGDIPGAYADLMAAGNVGPLSLTSSMALTAVHFRQGHRDKALQQAESTVRRFPMEAKAHHNYGVLLDQLGRGKEAEDEYRLALECNPDMLRTKLLLAQVLVRSNRGLKEARELAQGVAVKAPGDGTAAAVAARALYLQGQRERSLKELLEVQSEHRTNLLALFWIYEEAQATGNRDIAQAAAEVLQRVLATREQAGAAR